MPVELCEIVVPSVRRAIDVLLKLIDKAEAHYAARGLDPSTVAGLRLAPDMQPFAFQIESVIGAGLGAVARLRGQPPPKTPALASLDEMRWALQQAADWLAEVRPADFAGAETREIVLPSPKGARRFSGRDYVVMLALPNVHFHTAIAYALLRVAGVDLGKRDFLGQLPPREASLRG